MDSELMLHVIIVKGFGLFNKFTTDKFLLVQGFSLLLSVFNVCNNAYVQERDAATIPSGAEMENSLAFTDFKLLCC